MKHKLLWLVSISLLSVMGCSKDLSRRQVKKMLEDAQHKSHVELKEGVLTYEGTLKRSFPGEYCDNNTFLPYEVKSAKEDKLDKAGLVSMSEVASCGDWVMSLSPLAKQDKVAESELESNMVFIKTGTFKSETVTGIVQDGVHATADIEMRFSLTGSGEALAKAGAAEETKNCQYSLADKSIICRASVTFTRYDDGWRFDKPSKQQE